MKILVTGHKGFIGQNMVNALKDKHQISTYEWGNQYPILDGLDWVIHLGAVSSTTEKDIRKITVQNIESSIYLLNGRSNISIKPFIQRFITDHALCIFITIFLQIKVRRRTKCKINIFWLVFFTSRAM